MAGIEFALFFPAAAVLPNTIATNLFVVNYGSKKNTHRGEGTE